MIQIRIILYPLLLLLFSCTNQEKGKVFFDFSEKGEYTYPCDSTISSKDGILTNSETHSYLPSNFIFKKNDSTYIEPTGYDFEKVTYIKYPWENDTIRKTERLLGVEYAFNDINAPVLYNCYLGQDIYRLFLNRSFHPFEVYTFTKVANKTLLTEFRFKFEKDTIPNHLIVVLENKITTEFGLKEWNEFEKLIKEDNFWNLYPKNEDIGLDGTTWLMEGHKEDQYRFVYRWGSYSSMFESAKFLINLCNPTIEEKEIY